MEPETTNAALTLGLRGRKGSNKIMKNNDMIQRYITDRNPPLLEENISKENCTVL
jgi:hypothetical protein